jgi:hypothetical protein
MINEFNCSITAFINALLSGGWDVTSTGMAGNAEMIGLTIHNLLTNLTFQILAVLVTSIAWITTKN